MKSSNARLGVQLFFLYLLLYGGFVLINAFAPTLMEKTPIAGLNLAILYGFALIVGALVLSLIYGFLCSSEPKEDSVVGSSDASAEASR